MTLYDGREANFLNAYLTDSGSPNGEENQVGSFSEVSPGVFYLKPGVDEIYKIATIQFLIRVNSANISLDGYGDGVAALVNGFDFSIRTGPGANEEGTEQTNLLANRLVKTNLDLKNLISNFTVREVGKGTGLENVFQGSLNITTLVGNALRLVGKETDRLVIKIQDNLSDNNITYQSVLVIGAITTDDT